MIKAIKKVTRILLVVVLAACSVQEEKPVPVKFELSDQFSASGQDANFDEWWHDFNDTELDRLMTAAFRDNLDLRIIWDRLYQFEAIARREGADLIPSVDLEVSASRIEISDTADRNSLSLGLSAAYEVDIWGRIRSRQDAALYDLRATEEDLKTAYISLSALLASTWYQWVEQYGQIELLKNQLDYNQQVEELLTLRFRRGQTTAADVLQQRQLLESTRGNIINAESRLAILDHQLSVLTGKPPHLKLTPAGNTLIELTPLPDTGLPVELINRRPDIRKAYYDVQAADQRLASVIANRFPRISIRASGDTSGASASDLFSNWMANLAGNLVTPVIDGGSRRAEVDRSRAVLSQTINTYEQIILESLVEVEDALVQEQKQAELIISLEKQLVLSEQVIERIRDTYLNGATDYIRVLNTLITNQNLQRTTLEARRRLIEFRINLNRALAGGWETERPALAELSRE